MTNRLAALAHDIWARWMKYMFSTSEVKHGVNLSILEGESVGRWKRQMNTDYKDLSPKEQESDKKIAAEWARAVLEEYSDFNPDAFIGEDAAKTINRFIEEKIMKGD